MLRRIAMPKIRFSLRAFLLTLFVLSLIGSNLYVSWKWRESRGEIDRLREEMGWLKIDDPTRIYVRQVDSWDPLSWAWRIYLPPGERWVHAGSGAVAETGLKTSFGASTALQPRTRRGGAGPPDPLDCEFTLTARIERDQRGNLQLAVSPPHQRLTVGLMPKDTAWISDHKHFGLSTARKIEIEAASSLSQTRSFAADDTVVLLRLRAPDDKQAESGEPCDGIMIWFAPKKRGKP